MHADFHLKGKKKKKGQNSDRVLPLSFSYFLEKGS